MYAVYAVLPIAAALVLMTRFRVSPGKALPVALLLTAVSGALLWKMPLLQIAAFSLLGVLKSLRRLKSGMFDIADAVTVEQLKTMEQADLDIRLRKFLFEKLSRLPEVNS